MKDSPFNHVDAQMAAMKQDIADRTFNVKLKGYLISGALAAAAIGAIFVFPQAVGMLTPFIGIALAGGSALSAMATMKETKKLEIDEQYLRSRIEGGNWGEGNWKAYGEYVGKPGYAAPQAPVLQGTPTPRGPQRTS